MSGERNLGRLGWSAGLVALVAVLAACSGVAAAATPPPYTGEMTFPAIQGPADPEQFSWTVTPGEHQELRAIDDRTAGVFFSDGELAFQITAVAAHDAHGTTVPTTLAVSEGDVITLTVHHRAGNPAAGGAPFVYPVSAGAGWEGGVRTTPVAMPPPAAPTQDPASAQAAPCTVPRLKGRSLRAAWRALKRRGCRLGLVRGERRKGARVVRQWRAPGTVLPAGARVAVRLSS